VQRNLRRPDRKERQTYVRKKNGELIGKVEEKLKKWVEYFLLDFLIGQYQGGFRKSRSTTKLLPTAIEDVTGAKGEDVEENI
jgi:hypothetical protein